MNSCILMAKIVRTPELRYTQNDQTPFVQMLVEFEGFRPEDPASTLKVVAWGGLGTEVSQSYNEGDRVVIEGRLSMNTLDRPEGFKEKRAELVVSRIFRLDSAMTETQSEPPKPVENLVSMDAYKSKQPAPEPAPSQGYTAFVEEDENTFAPLVPVPSTVSDEDLDDIPF